LTVALAAGLGGSDELFQRSIPGRTCSIWDWTADLTGAILGSFSMYRIENKVPNRLWWLGLSKAHADTERELG
jgi:VanZ family protein